MSIRTTISYNLIISIKGKFKKTELVLVTLLER